MLELNQLIGFGVGGVGPLSFVGAGSAGLGVNPSASVPAGVQAGDLLVIWGVSGSGSGWSNAGGSWATLANYTTNGPNVVCAWKIAGASESAVAFTNNHTGANVIMLAYRNSAGVDVGGSVVYAASNSNSTTTTLTTTSAGDLVLSMYGSNSTSTVFTAPAGVNTRVNFQDGVYRSMLIVDEIQAAAGSTTSRTATLSGSSNNTNYAASFKQA